MHLLIEKDDKDLGQALLATLEAQVLELPRDGGGATVQPARDEARAFPQRAGRGLPLGRWMRLRWQCICQPRARL